MITQIGRRLASRRITVWLLLLLMMIVFAGTFYQVWHGLHAAQKQFYYAWLTPLIRNWAPPDASGFLAGVASWMWFPLPGGVTVLWALGINLVFSLVFRIGFRWRNVGNLLIHTGLLVMLVGGWLAHRTAESGFVSLAEGDATSVAVPLAEGAPSLTLPLTIRLIEFEAAYMPGSRISRRYASRIEVTGPGVDRQVLVEMNRPFRYGTFTFFQSSYGRADDGRNISVFAVTRNRWMLAPYVATGMMSLGLILQFMLHLFRRTAKPGVVVGAGAGRAAAIIAVIFAYSLCIRAAEAADSSTIKDAMKGYPADPVAPFALDLDAFRRIPVLHNGRKMPMDAFARQRLATYGGRRTVGGEPAVAWLARVFFLPETAMQDPVFLLTHPESVQALGLTASGRRTRASVADLQPVFEKLEAIARKAYEMDASERSLVESELLRLYSHLLEYFDFARSFSFAFPGEPFVVHDDFLRRALQLPMDRTVFSYLEMYRRGAGLRPLMRAAQDMTRTEWTAREHESVALSMALYDWTKFFEDTHFAFIPVMENGGEKWLSTWNAIASGHMRDPAVADAIDTLHSLAQAYGRGDQAAFDEAARSYDRFVRECFPGYRDLRWIGLEVRLNDWNPFLWSGILYVLSFLVALAAVSTRTGGQASGRIGRLLHWAAFGLCAAALLPHTAGLVMRTIIMGRPPATNLFSTFLFVAWVSALLGLLLEMRQRLSLGTLMGALSGAALLLVANGVAGSGDTMGKVAAVLSSNAWLGAHVLTITMGYAGLVLAGMVGQIWLVCACISPNRRTILYGLQRSLYGMLGFGLTFTFIGTTLGGLWADQSWGRFWGWDPKENGALLIILWCAVLLHARLARMIGDVGMAAGSVFGVVVVMFAWLGVNLLGVGLHSYGFTSGLASGLITYITVQLCILAIVTPLALTRIRQR
jgi:ABC-type transport system involved in cytochrome c biogenesis permease subunit